jgi:hypothetical protein
VEVGFQFDSVIKCLAQASASSFSVHFLASRLWARPWFDFDNDGDLDLLMSGATNTLSGTLTNYVTLLYRNDSALFVPVQTGFENSGLGGSIWGDFNADGWSDVLITGRLGGGENPARLFLNGGNGMFTWSTNTGLPQVFTGGGALADVEGDGRLDVLLTGTAGGLNGVTRLFQNLSALRTRHPSRRMV